MKQLTLAEATGLLDEFVYALDNAYWQASSVDHKDRLYNLIRLLTEEVIELHKVSVQDGGYPYEPAGDDFTELDAPLNWLKNNLDEVCKRSGTHQEVSALINQVSWLVK